MASNVSKKKKKKTDSSWVTYSWRLLYLRGGVVVVGVVGVAMVGCIRSHGLPRGDGCRPSPAGDAGRSLSDGQHFEDWSICAVNWLVFSSDGMGALEVMTIQGETEASLRDALPLSQQSHKPGWSVLHLSLPTRAGQFGQPCAHCQVVFSRA